MVRAGLETSKLRLKLFYFQWNVTPEKNVWSTSGFQIPFLSIYLSINLSIYHSKLIIYSLTEMKIIGYFAWFS